MQGGPLGSSRSLLTEASSDCSQAAARWSKLANEFPRAVQEVLKRCRCEQNVELLWVKSIV
jgi:hypothetical protein